MRMLVEMLPRLTNLREIVSHTFSIDEAPKAYETRVHRDGLKSEVVFAGVA